METKVLGSECSNCHSTTDVIARAARAAGVEVNLAMVERPDDVGLSHGCSTTAPSLVSLVQHCCKGDPP